MIGDVKMQTIKRRTGRSLTVDQSLFLALIECFRKVLTDFVTCGVNCKHVRFAIPDFFS